MILMIGVVSLMVLVELIILKFLVMVVNFFLLLKGVRILKLWIIQNLISLLGVTDFLVVLL